MLIVQTDYLWLKRLFPRVARSFVVMLSALNILASIGTLTSPQPNIGTILSPWGLLAYAGVLTPVANLLSVINHRRGVRRLIQAVTMSVLVAVFVLALAWIVHVWLFELLTYYQPYLFIILLSLGILTVWLAIRSRNQPKGTRDYWLTTSAFSLTVIIEMTSVFVVANLLLLIFLGLALNP